MIENKKEWERRMSAKLNAIFGDWRGDRYGNPVYDPVQTHALYGITASDIDKFKEDLKRIGAKRFRTVSNRFGFKILCFNAEKIKL